MFVKKDDKFLFDWVIVLGGIKYVYVFMIDWLMRFVDEVLSDIVFRVLL